MRTAAKARRGLRVKRRFGERFAIPAMIAEYKVAGGWNSASLPAISESKARCSLSQAPSSGSRAACSRAARKIGSRASAPFGR